MKRKLNKSKALFKKYEHVVASGTHSNFRSPIYFEKAKGSRIWDIDGNEYIDCIANNGACILGHGDPDIEKAVKAMIESGLTHGLETEFSLKVAGQLKKMVPSAEQVRFTVTGTGAVMNSLMIARAFTGKSKIVKLEGGFNGTYDDVLISTSPEMDHVGPKSSPIAVKSSDGLRANVEKTTIPIPFNDVENTVKIIESHKTEIGAVIVEPVIYNCGCIEPDIEYLRCLRDITKKNRIVLIFDEMVTGFAIAPGGAQEYYNVIPDLTTLGKAMANGYPLSAVVGKRELMDLTHPKMGRVRFGGTYNSHQVTLAAASVCLEKLATGKIQKRLKCQANELKKKFDSLTKELGVEARLYCLGGRFHVYFSNHEITDYRSAATTDKEKYLKFQEVLFDNGIFMKKNYLTFHAITYAHTKKDIEQIAGAMEQGLRQVIKLQTIN